MFCRKRGYGSCSQSSHWKPPGLQGDTTPVPVTANPRGRPSKFLPPGILVEKLSLFLQMCILQGPPVPQTHSPNQPRPQAQVQPGLSPGLLLTSATSFLFLPHASTPPTRGLFFLTGSIRCFPSWLVYPQATSSTKPPGVKSDTTNIQLDVGPSSHETGTPGGESDYKKGGV